MWYHENIKNLTHIPVECTIKVNPNNHFVIILLHDYTEIQLSICCDIIGTKNPNASLHFTLYANVPSSNKSTTVINHMRFYPF